MNHEKYKQPLSVEFDKGNGPTLVLEDLEHRDYIEDVLCEHYDIEYEYMLEDEKSGKNTLHFGSKIEVSVIQGAIEKINAHHVSEETLYKTV